MRVFLVFQTKNPEPILNCALIGRISSNQVACQRSAVWRLGLEIFIFFSNSVVEMKKRGYNFSPFRVNRVIEELKKIWREAENVAIATGWA